MNNVKFTDRPLCGGVEGCAFCAPYRFDGKPDCCYRMSGGFYCVNLAAIRAAIEAENETEE